MVVPVVTAVAEQEIPFVRQDVLFCTHLHATCPLFLVWW